MKMPDRNMIFHPAFIMYQLILPLMFDIGFLSSFVVCLIWFVNQCVQNLDYVVKLREYPYNKKGKRSTIMDMQ